MRRAAGAGTINAAGYVQIQRGARLTYEHILIAEAVLGRPLPPHAQMHHVDGDEGNNANTNLVICPDQAYHQLLHRRTKALEACGHAGFMVCRHCRRYDDPGSMKRDGSRSWSHPACRNKYRRQRYAAGKTR